MLSRYSFCLVPFFTSFLVTSCTSPSVLFIMSVSSLSFSTFISVLKCFNHINFRHSSCLSMFPFQSVFTYVRSFNQSHFSYFVHFLSTIFGIKPVISLLRCLCLRSRYRSFTLLLACLLRFSTLRISVL